MGKGGGEVSVRQLTAALSLVEQEGQAQGLSPVPVSYRGAIEGCGGGGGRVSVLYYAITSICQA